MSNTFQMLNDITSGMLSGSLSVFLFYPLDIVRTRLQVQHVLLGKAHASSITKTSMGLYAQHGLRGFYQGLTTNLVGSSLAWGIYFSIFHRLQRGIASHLHVSSIPNHDSISNHDSSFVISSTPSASSPNHTPSEHHDSLPAHRALLPPHLNFLCGIGAGVFATVLTTPIWIVKTRIQVSDLQPEAQRYTGLLQGLRSVLAAEGPAGLTRGMAPALWATSHTAIQFTLYEELLKLSASSAHEPARVLLCGALSKVAASALTTPFQVIKARVQLHAPARQVADATPFSLSWLQCARQTLQHEGAAGLYRGWLLTLLRTVPSSALTMFLFEMISDQLKF